MRSEVLPQLVWAQAQARPEARAIVDGSRSISYRALAREAHGLAHALIERGVAPSDRVCLFVPKSIEALTTMLAVLESGASYVPLDVGSPAARLIKVLATCSPCWIVASPVCRDLVAECLRGLPAAFAARVLWLPGDEGGHEPSILRADARHADRAPALERDGSAIAYVIFTSGSTGEPKGVQIAHDGVLAFVHASNAALGVDATDRISCHAPLHFDASVWDMYSAFSAGAELHLVPAQVNLLPNLLSDFIRAQRLTQWGSVPSTLTAMAARDVVSQDDYPCLRRLVWYGEAFAPSALRYWMDRLPHVEFINAYGTTEVTIVSSLHRVARDSVGRTAVPIGIPLTDKPMLILDEHGEPAPDDTVGEIYLGGIGVSPGYLGDPDKTARAFVERPRGSGRRWYRSGDLGRRDAQGVFHFHGRADRQIKSRGHRIELDEVAIALSRVDGVRESAVVAVVAPGFEGMRICAAYALKPGVEMTPARLRAELSLLLPSSMLPRRWLSLAELPKNQSGKIDHRALVLAFEAQDTQLGDAP